MKLQASAPLPSKACNRKTYLGRKIDSQSTAWQLFTDDVLAPQVRSNGSFLTPAAVPRSQRWCSPDARRFKPVGFSFALVGLDLLLLAFRPWFLARLDPVGRIWRPIAVRTFFEGRGGYWPYENSGLPPVH